MNPPIAGSGSNISMSIPPSYSSESSPDLSMVIIIAIILLLYFAVMFFTKGKKERVK